MTTTAYTDFLARRSVSAPAAGFSVADSAMHPSLFPFQKHALRLACEAVCATERPTA